MRSIREINDVLAQPVWLSDVEVARRTGIPRRTVRDWRSGRIPGRLEIGSLSRACPICIPGSQAVPERDYAYALGLYLGDGCVSAMDRSYRLRIFLDAAYPNIVAECRRALESLRPDNRVWIGRSKTCRLNVVSVFSNHWPCLLPQMGPGRKHSRPIRLEPWQEEVVGRERRALIRGLLHSDGCRVVANDRGVMSVRYHFSNKSEDIKRIFCENLDALGIHWTRPCNRQIAVYRKACTALLDEFVGPKR